MAAAALALLFLAGGCGERPYLVQLFFSDSVGGTPYLVVETAAVLQGPEGGRSYFALYKPASADLAEWAVVEQSRTGPVFGSFVHPTPSGDVLGLLHDGRATLWRFEADGFKTEVKLLPFRWAGETGAVLDGKVYVFGGRFGALKPGQPRQAGRVAAAVYDGQEFRELDVPAPELEAGPYGHFWIKAVAHAGRTFVFWRAALSAPVPDFEALVDFTGPLRMVSFDGAAFDPTVREVAELPLGQPDVWSNGKDLRVVVQPHAPGIGKGLPLRLFTLSAAGALKEDPLPQRDGGWGLRFKYFAVARLPVAGRDVFLRGNSQRFELWEALPAGWQVTERPRGLPEYNLESVVLGALAFCLALVGAGAGMAFRRRRQLRWILERLRPQDVYAPISLRVAAHLVDVGAIAVVTELALRLAELPPPRWSIVLLDFQFLSAYAAAYLIYLTLAEWRVGQTLGKWLFDLQVVTDRGEKLTLWAALVRNFVGLFERHFLLAAFAALPAMLFTPKSQRVGDLLARTLVVQKEAFARYKSEREGGAGGA